MQTTPAEARAIAKDAHIFSYPIALQYRSCLRLPTYQEFSTIERSPQETVHRVRVVFCAGRRL